MGQDHDEFAGFGPPRTAFNRDWLVKEIQLGFAEEEFHERPILSRPSHYNILAGEH